MNEFNQTNPWTCGRSLATNPWTVRSTPETSHHLADHLFCINTNMGLSICLMSTPTATATASIFMRRATFQGAVQMFSPQCKHEWVHLSCVLTEKRAISGAQKRKNLLKLCPKAKQKKKKNPLTSISSSRNRKVVGLFCMCILGVRSSSRVFAFICSPSNAMTGLSIPKPCVANYWPGMQTATF